LRAMGYPVRTVAFGESIALEPRRGVTRVEERRRLQEERYVYLNRRAQLYGELSILMNPAGPRGGWAVDPDAGTAHLELIRQLSLIPTVYDREGRLKIPPKDRDRPDSQEVTLRSILGRSPDEADAVVLAAWAMQHRPNRSRAGVA